MHQRQARGLGRPSLRGLSARPFQAVAETVAQWGALQQGLGEWRLPTGGLAIWGDRGELEKGLHLLRVSSRMCSFQHWLSKDRVDAVLAREQGTSVTFAQLEVLRKLALKLPRDAQQIMCG
eukprot:11749275-Alexandrium_andersonii.AAC.1